MLLTDTAPNRRLSVGNCLTASCAKNGPHDGQGIMWAKFCPFGGTVKKLNQNESLVESLGCPTLQNSSKESIIFLTEKAP
jgi:hypothetical protein